MDNLLDILAQIGPNQPDKREGFTISYNPQTDVGVETAIVFEKDGKEKFYILLGDHREGYKDKSFEECVEYFKKNQDQVSQWSATLD